MQAQHVNHIFFSIVVPAYKKKYLKECIDSVFSQTYDRYELIIVNDNSPENLDSIIDYYSDSRLYYYKNSEGFGAVGVVGNWNRCLEYVKGDFVICMGDDDVLLPHCLEQYVSLINRFPNLNVFHARFRLIDGESRIHRSNYIDKREQYETTYDLLKNRFCNRYQFIGDHLFRTSELKRVGGFVYFPCAWFSDEISVALLAGTKGVASTDEIVFQYRINDRTISNNNTLTEYKIEACDQAFEWYQEFICNNDSFTQEQRDELIVLLRNRINGVKNTCIAFDMSFGLFRGYLKWRKNSSSKQLIKNLLAGLRIKSSRVIHRFFS